MPEYQLRCRSTMKYAFYRQIINIFLYQVHSYAKQPTLRCFPRLILDLDMFDGSLSGYNLGRIQKLFHFRSVNIKQEDHSKFVFF